MIRFSVLLIITGCIYSQCSRQDDVPSGYLERQAVLVNQLPADGCDWHFVLDVNEDVVQWVASTASQPIVKKFLEAHHGSSRLDVRITYKLTGNEQEVICGWGTTIKMPEIELAALQKR